MGLAFRCPSITGTPKVQTTVRFEHTSSDWITCLPLCCGAVLTLLPLLARSVPIYTETVGATIGTR